MKGKKIILLFIGLLLPVCVFVFLKMFGRNEFQVEPLFADALPDLPSECGVVSYQLPYHLPDSIVEDINFGRDSLICVFFASGERAESTGAKLKEKHKNDPVRFTFLDPVKNVFTSKCIFLLAEPFDVALVDRKGVLRGHYNSSKRDELDRLSTEITIILKKY